MLHLSNGTFKMAGIDYGDYLEIFAPTPAQYFRRMEIAEVRWPVQVIFSSELRSFATVLYLFGDDAHNVIDLVGKFSLTAGSRISVREIDPSRR